MPSTRTWALTFGGALLLTIVFAALGWFLESGKTVDQRAALQLPAMAVFFTLFLVMGFSGLALMIRVFVALQQRIGNATHPVVRFLAEHDTGIILGLFALCVAGLAFAIPAAIGDGFFGSDAKRWLDGLFRGRPTGSNR